MSPLFLFGLPPTLPGPMEQALGKRFVEYLGDQLKTPIEVRVAASYSELEDTLAEGKLDFAWLPPLPASQLQRHCGVAILAHAVRSGGDEYYSVVFTREDSPITEQEHLADVRMAYVHRRSASGFLMVSTHLRRVGIQVRQPPSFFGSHARVAEAVASGEADAGATFCNYEGDPEAGVVGRAGWTQARVEQPMRVLLRTAPIPSDVICAWPGTSLSARARLVDALARMPGDAELAILLTELFGAERFAPTGGRGYELLDAAVYRP